MREMKGSAGPLDNDPKLVAAINPALTALLGTGNVLTSFPSVMGSEDFQEAFANHNDDFVVDLPAIPLGTRVNTLAALSLLGK